MDKHPVLNIDRSTLNSENTLSPNNDPHIKPMSVNSNSSQGITKSSSISCNRLSRNYISTQDLHIQRTLSSLDLILIMFSEDLNGLPIIIVESTSKDSNIGKLQTMNVGKLFFNKFNDIQRIDSSWSKGKSYFKHNSLCQLLLGM